MVESSQQLSLCVLTQKDIQFDTVLNDSLQNAGFHVDVHDGPVYKSSAASDRTYDCFIVDWRNFSVEVAEHYANSAGMEPVVALIKADQAVQDLSLIAGFNDFVSEPEIGLVSFKLRIARLVARYRDPLSLTSTKTPEGQLLQTIVNNSSDWLFLKDLDHRFLALSEEYANSLELQLDNVIGKNDLEIGFSEDVVLGSEKSVWRGFWPQDDEAVELGEPTIENNPYWRVQVGDKRHRRTVRVPLKNRWDDVYGLLICSEDVTAIVKTEEMLRERSEMLEKVTQEKLKADHSRLMAELAVTAKNKFIATASHDLRQPLHALGLYLDVLETKVTKDDEKELITKIKNSSNALSVLFNSLLDLSRLDAGVVEVTPTHFHLNPLLNSLNVEFKEVAADKSLEVNFKPVDSVVFTDVVLLERILRNLIQNAVTYTNQGSIDVSCEKVNDKLRINVADTGPGIPQYEQNAIFSEYYQLDNQGRRPTIGLGLGLAIVRRLVDLLDVKFELRSGTGVGSVFSLELPIGDSSLVADETIGDIDLQLSGHTVLVIDDEADILDGMKYILDGHGCKSIVAQSVREAISKLNDTDAVPTMIVADYRLQNGQTGDVAIGLIREEFNSDIPAIIVTGDTSADRLKEATASGFKLVHKPVQADELVGKISSVLSSQQ